MGVLKDVIGIVLVLALILMVLYVYSLSQVDVERITINELQDISLTGFTLGGDIYLYNGGIIPVWIDHIDYKIILESSGNELTSGYIKGTMIPPRKTVNFPFSKKINWIPSAEVAWGLITPGKTYAKIFGTVYVADLKFIDFKIPFEKKVDLEVYIRQFAKTKFEETVDKVTDTITDVVDKIGEGINTIGGKISEGLGKIFD